MEKSSDVQRYSVRVCPDCDCEDVCSALPKRDPEGYWVTHDDYIDLRRVAKQLQTALKGASAFYTKKQRIKAEIAEVAAVGFLGPVEETK